MSVELEGLEFQIEVKSNDSLKHIDSLTENINKLKKAVKGGLGLNASIKQIGNLKQALAGFHSDSLESLSKALNSLSNVKASIPATIPKRITELGKSLQTLTSEGISNLERVGQALKGIGNSKDIKVPKLNTSSGSARSVSISPQTHPIQQVAKNSGIEQISGAMKPFSDGISDCTKRASTGASSINKLSKSMSRVKSTTSSAKSATRQFSSSLNSMGSILKKCTSGLRQFATSLGRIAMYRMVRFILAQITQALKDGINNLYRWSNALGGAFAQNMDRLSTSSLYLKNSLAAMVSPLINALAPAIDFVTDKIVTLLNYINQLFSRLTGASSFTAARKVAKSYGDSLADTGSSAAKAAKEIRDATLGIDELNIIMQDDPSKGSGGSGSRGTDYGSMFEQLPIDSGISEFADKLKEAFESANWKELGTLLGDKVNELIDSIDWEGAGHKLGYGLNGAIQTTYWFLDTIDFTGIGTHLAELINGSLEEIDFSFVGRVIAKGFTFIPDIIIGAVTTLDWGLIGKSVSDLIKGAFDEITGWFNKYDWNDLGSTVWQKLKDLFTNLDFGGIASSLFTEIGTALRSSASFLGGFFGSIGEDIKNWWNEDIKGTNWKDTATNLLKAIGKGFKNIGTWVWENIIDPFGQALLGEKWDSVKDVGSNIMESVKSGWDSVCKLGKNIGEFFVNVKNDAEEWRDNVRNWWAERKLNVESFFTNVSNDVEDWRYNVREWWAEKTLNVECFFTDVADNSKEWWESVKNWWSNKVESVEEFTTYVADKAKDWWSSVNGWWHNVVGDVEKFKTYVEDKSGEWWESVKSWWSGKVGDVKKFTTYVEDRASDWWGSVKDWWSNRVGDVEKFTTYVKDQSSDWWGSVKDWWNNQVWGKVLEVGVGIKDEASQWWDSVKNAWDTVSDKLTTVLDIEVPHISIEWGETTVFGKSFSYPTGFNVEWYANGGILDGAQIFGMLGGNFLGGGEAGKEAVLPLETHTAWMDTLAEKVRNGLPENDKNFKYEGFKQALADFYGEYMQGTMNQIADDMNRQANKREQTTVQIGNKVVTDAVTTQREADGYRFTT